MSSVEIIKQRGLSVYLMEISENQLDAYSNGLTSLEKKRLAAIHHPAKQKEFLASRFLRTELFGLREIHYTEVGAPFIENEGYLSISHTENLVGISRSQEFRVGLDLELIREKAVATSRRFLHDSEKAFFDPTSAYDMSLLWSFKETLFKLAGRKGIHFSSNLIVEQADGAYRGSVVLEESARRYELSAINFQHYLVTCNTSDATYIL